jgi:RNA polymerase sigma factor (sigma-70 family)
VEEASDEELIRRFARGEAAAFERLYRRHEMRVWRYLYRSVENRAIADELMQEVWFAVAREAGRFEPRARFTTWLYTIARHRMIDSLRAAANRPHASVDELEATDPPPALLAREEPANDAAIADESRALLAALGALPGEQREAFLLKAEGGLSLEEIGALTGASFETVKSRLRYARAKLREALKEYLA